MKQLMGFLVPNFKLIQVIAMYTSIKYFLCVHETICFRITLEGVFSSSWEHLTFLPAKLVAPSGLSN